MRTDIMFPLGKLLGILAVKRTLDTTIFQHLLLGAAVFVLLTVIAALMVAILIMGGLYGIDIVLLSYGLAPDAAAIMVASLTVLITVVVILLMRVQINKMHGMIKRIVKQQSPIGANITEHATDIVQSFISGLMDPKPSIRKE